MRELNKSLWPYKVVIDLPETRPRILEIETWLGDRHGPARHRWNVVYHYACTNFYFRENQDAVMFALKWS